MSGSDWGEPLDGEGHMQCAAQRPVSGGRLGVALLKCFLLDGHDGPHTDTTEGIDWTATRLQGAGGVHLGFLTGRGRSR